MRILFIFILLLGSIPLVGQDFPNSMDNRGLKQGNWLTRDTFRLNILNSKGQYLDNKKVGKWTYFIEELADTSKRQCQQLFTYEIKTEYFLINDSVIVETFWYSDRTSYLKFNKDSSLVSGQIFSLASEKYSPANCECSFNLDIKSTTCLIKTQKGHIIERFPLSNLSSIVEKVNWGFYDRTLKWQ